MAIPPFLNHETNEHKNIITSRQLMSEFVVCDIQPRIHPPVPVWNPAMHFVIHFLILAHPAARTSNPCTPGGR